MQNNKSSIDLLLKINLEEQTDSNQLDLLTRSLRGELFELGVESADLLPAEDLPEGAKTADPVTIGVLAVAVLPGFLTKLVEYLQAWCMRGENRKVRIKTQVGERSVEVEYSPSALSEDELLKLVHTLTGSLDSQEAVTGQ
jgi:hypothetical protein